MAHQTKVNSMKKAIKINVETKMIEEIVLGDSFKDIYPAIGNGCTCFCVPMHYPNGDAMYADDESLLRPNDIVGGFIMEGWEIPLIGNAIILGTDDEGNSVSCATRIEDIAEKLFFIDAETSRLYAESALAFS